MIGWMGDIDVGFDLNLCLLSAKWLTFLGPKVMFEEKNWSNETIFYWKHKTQCKTCTYDKVCGGCFGTKFCLLFGFVLFWANLDMVEFWLKSESVLKEKYSKCQSRNFWTESRLAQEKTQNPTQLGSSHSLLFIGGGLSHKTAFPLSCHEAWLKREFICHPTNNFTLVFKNSSCSPDMLTWKEIMKILHFFDFWVSSGRLSLLWADVIDKTFG